MSKKILKELKIKKILKIFKTLIKKIKKNLWLLNRFKIRTLKAPIQKFIGKILGKGVSRLMFVI